MEFASKPPQARITELHKINSLLPLFRTPFITMKVLIIEDSEEFSKSLLDFFNYDGHSTDFAPNLSSAYDYVAVSKFDIILLDIMLPDGDGRDFLKKIRKQNITIPVIVMTARSEVSDKIDLLDIGADDYIIKPFDLNELEARCRAVLRRQSGQNQTYLKFKKESCSYIKKWPSEIFLHGWHVVLKKQGYNTAHIHPTGWLSGVIYLKVAALIGPIYPVFFITTAVFQALKKPIYSLYLSILSSSYFFDFLSLGEIGFLHPLHIK